MAPFAEATETNLAFVRHDETTIYTGTVDSEWTIGSVPHGGYLLALITSATVNYQSLRTDVRHPDPAHLSAQFLSATSMGPFEVHIKTFSASKRWTRLLVTLCQRNKDDLSHPHTRISAWMMFTDLPELGVPVEPNPEECTVLPNTPSPFARLCPLKVDPGSVKAGKQPSVFNFNKHFKWGQGKQVFGGDGPHREDTEGRRKLEWGAWMEMTDAGDEVSIAMMPFFADIFMNGPELLPKAQQPPDSWYPTLTLSLHFHAKFPLKPTPISANASLPIAKHTVGLYGHSHFIHQGRHDMTVEVWSAPSELGTKCEVGSEEWRKGAQILAVSTQVALVVDASVNTRKGKL